MRAGSHPQEAIRRRGRWWEISPTGKVGSSLAKTSTIWLLCPWMELLRVALPLSVWPAFTSPHPHTQPLLPFDHPSVWAAVSSFPSRLWQREPGVFLLRGDQGVVDLEIRPFFISVGAGSIHRDHKLIYLQKGHFFKWLTAEAVRPYCLDFS